MEATIRQSLPVPQVDPLNFAAFRTFANEQDPEREINHDAWSTCAVGDFFENVHGRRPTVVEAGLFSFGLPQSEEEEGDIRGAVCNCITYGGLAAVLNSFDAEDTHA